MKALLQIAYVVARRRIVSEWRLELVLFLGIALAVALMSSGVVFSDLLAEVALRRTLEQATPEQANFSIRMYSGQDTPPTASYQASAYRAALDFVERRVASRFGPYERDHAHLLETSTFFFKGRPHLELDNKLRPRGGIKYMSGLWPDRVQVVHGAWPTPPAIPLSHGGQPEDVVSPLEVAIDTLGAELLGLGVGDQIEVFPAAWSKDPPSMKVKIVGVFRRTNPDDEFWYGTRRSFSFKDDQWTIIPLFTTQEGILEQVSSVYPGMYTDVTWFFYLDRYRVRADDVGAIQNTIRRIEYEVRTGLANSSYAIRLDKLLEEHQEQLLLARTPLFLMVFLVTGILIYYLALVAGLIVRSRVTEISMLKSRGSTTFQVGVLSLVEGLLLAVPAVAVAPLLALSVVRGLGSFFFGLGGGSPLTSVPVGPSLPAFLLGGAGGLLAVIVLTVSTLVAARQGIVEFRHARARPPGTPFIHRYYLDLLLLALIGLVWWQIQSQGSFLVRPLGDRGLQLDFSLLLGPVLGLLALGLLVMRIFPILLSLLARAAEPIGPVWLVQGLRRVSRDPIVPGSLVVLLMLATALGVIGSAVSATVERSQRERALYAAGVDLRLQHDGDRTPVPLLGLTEPVDKLQSVLKSAEVQRASGTLLTSGFSTTTVSILAVDTDSFAQVAWYRPDFAGGVSLGELTRALKPTSLPSFGSREIAGGGAAGGLMLPREATAMALWVHPGRPDPRLSLRARLQDSRGYYFDVVLGELDFRGWRRLQAALSPALPATRGSLDRARLTVVTPPFTLLAFQVFSQGSVNEPGVLFLQGLEAVTPSGTQAIDDFQTPSRWHAVEDYYRPGLYAMDSSESVTRGGAGSSVAFSWAPGGIGFRGVGAGEPLGPIPAVVSKSLLEAGDARLGDTLRVGMSTFAIPVKIVATADYFPTLDPQRGPFALVDLRTFTHQLNMHSQRLHGGTNELWIRLGPTHNPAPAWEDHKQSAAGIIELLSDRDIRVREALIASEMVTRRLERPLVSASWGGLLVLMFLALVLASASGVMLFSFMDTRERQTEFALLRTLGSSKAQLNGVLWFNLFLVVAFGIGLGTWAGQQIGAGLLPILGVAEEGTRVTPPMILQTNWYTLLASYLVLAGITAGTVVWLAWFSAKLEAQQVLRIGEGQ